MNPPQRFLHSLHAAPLVGICGLLLACQVQDDARAAGRMILIGIDGASPRIVNQLIREDRLPTLAKIAREGVRGPLRSSIPIQSPRIWNTIATGKVPEKHGIVSFSYRGREGEQRLYASTDRKTPTLWSIANAAGRTVGVVNFWNTYPLENVNGVMVSDHVLAKEIEGRHRMAGAKQTDIGAVIHPEAWNIRLERHIENAATPVPDFPDPFSEDKVLPRWVLRDELQRRFKEDGALAQMALEISQTEKPEVMMVLLPGIDRVSHYIWGVVEPPDDYPAGLVPTEEGREGGKAALFSYYEYTDTLIAAITADFGPNDLVMIVSDHGFEAGEALLRLTGVHKSAKALHGVLYARGPGIEPGSHARGVSVNDVTPTLLSWLRLPAARDMDGVRANFLASTGIAPVETYNDLALEYVNPETTPSGVEGEVIEHLKSLGYIESE